MLTDQVVATLGADWGTVSAQLSAWFSLAALIVASIGGWFAFQSFKRQGDQVRQLEQDKRAEQASKVAAWLETSWSGLNFMVRNASDVPVYSVVLYVLPHVKRPHGRRYLDVLPPGSPQEIESLVPVPDDESRIGLVGMTFVDAQGRPWMRWGPTPLVELSRTQADTLNRMLIELESGEAESIPFTKFYRENFTVPAILEPPD